MPSFSIRNRQPLFPTHPTEVVDRLQESLAEQGIHALFLTCQSQHITSYTPLPNNQRYAATGFTGSTGNCFVLSHQLQEKTNLTTPVLLFVDGRYEIQAKQECNSKVVTISPCKHHESEVVKLGGILSRHTFTEGKTFRLGYDASRTTATQLASLQSLSNLLSLELVRIPSETLDFLCGLPEQEHHFLYQHIPHSWTGRHVTEAIAELFSGWNDSDLFLTSRPSEISWLLNTRDFTNPFSSSTIGTLLTTNDRGVLIVQSQERHPTSIEIPFQQNFQGKSYVLTRVQDYRELCSELKKLKPSQIHYNASSVTVETLSAVKELFPHVPQDDTCCDVQALRQAKNPTEQQSLRNAFLRSSRAIAKTMRWLKNPKNQETSAHGWSERAVALKIEEEYRSEGALGLSFCPIAGAAENGAIVHYTQNSPTKFLQPGDLVLLDSGAYYKEGMATDCTRVAFIPGREPETWQKRIYTIALKSYLAGARTRFSFNTHTLGDIDAACRSVVRRFGYDYPHGTGHDIGLDVHDGGLVFREGSTAPIPRKACVSIEPGIYLEGKGGVRIEDVALIQPDPLDSNMGYFEVITRVGFDWDLIDMALLTPEEMDDLAGYERECQRLGTDVTPCPLV